jgi:hypothetical protein
VSVGSELAVCGFYSVGELSDEHDLITVMNFAKAHSSYKTVASFFYMHSIGGLDKQNILTWN